MSIIYRSQIHRYVFVVFARQATVVRFHENVAVLSDLCWLGQCDWGMRKMKTRSYLMVEPNHADTLPYVSVISWSTIYRFIFKMLCGYFLAIWDPYTKIKNTSNSNTWNIDLTWLLCHYRDSHCRSDDHTSYLHNDNPYADKYARNWGPHV